MIPPSQRRPVIFSHERLDDMASMFLEMEVSGQVHAMNRFLATIYDKVVVTTHYSAGEWIYSSSEDLISKSVASFNPGESMCM